MTWLPVAVVAILLVSGCVAETPPPAALDIELDTVAFSSPAIASWDTDLELDGIELTLQPLGPGTIVPEPGTITAELRESTPEADLVVAWTREIVPEDYTATGVILRLEFPPGLATVTGSGTLDITFTTLTGREFIISSPLTGLPIETVIVITEPKGPIPLPDPLDWGSVDLAFTGVGLSPGLAVNFTLTNSGDHSYTFFFKDASVAFQGLEYPADKAVFDGSALSTLVLLPGESAAGTISFPGIPATATGNATLTIAKAFSWLTNNTINFYTTLEL
ncbi:MAG: hypothetical protein HY369_04120 [Candidatus Aenigmarchaeota archaeon]|nr:hypothetical protein [Candidatus Aenigmarchaeota archaeon]